MDQPPIGKRKEIIAGLAVLLLIVVIVTATSLQNKKNEDSIIAGANTASQSNAQTNPTTDTNNATSSYKDGSYTATGSYGSPGGIEEITITVNLQNNAVASTSAESGANDSDSKEYQSQFITNYKQLVVGKDISTLRLSRVSGSSLTSQGFNDALDQIKQQAQQTN